MHFAHTRRRALRAALAAAALATAALSTAACSGSVDEAATATAPAASTTAASPTTAAPETPGTSGTAATSTGTGGAVACGPDDVDVTVGEVEAAASSRAVPLTIRPVAGTTCLVTNPIGVTLVDAAGNPLPTTVDPSLPPAGRTAVDTIPPEIGAVVRIEWRVVPSGPADPDVDCISAEGLRLRLSEGSTPVPVTTGLTACDAGTLFVGPADVNAG